MHIYSSTYWSHPGAVSREPPLGTRREDDARQSRAGTSPIGTERGFLAEIGLPDPVNLRWRKIETKQVTKAAEDRGEPGEESLNLLLSEQS